jgi:cytochrome c-type biogenesis protein CcmF
MWPAIGAAVVAVFLVITPPSWGTVFGLRPWQDISYFYSLMAISLSVMVTLTVGSEFYRGGRVISKHTGQGIFASMVQLTHRNTRRYGGYIVHFGVVVVIIGLAGGAFNQDREMEMKSGDQMTIGPYTLICRSSTEDDNANYFSQWALLDVYKGGKLIDTMSPVRRFYHASQQTSTMPDIRSTLNEDLYLVFEGVNQQNGHPILKAHLNALVMWIWMGVWIMLIGTVLALVPNAPAPVRSTVAERLGPVHATPAVSGD